MIRPGKVIKASSTADIPETLSQLPKKNAERTVPVTVRIRESLVQKLQDGMKKHGYTQQEIFNMALEAFLK